MPCFFSYIFTTLCLGFPGWSHFQLCCFIVPANTFIIIGVYIQICGLENIVIITTQYVSFPQSLLLLSFWSLVHEHPPALKTAFHNLPWWGPAPFLATFSSSGYFAWEPDFACLVYFTEWTTICISFLSISEIHFRGGGSPACLRSMVDSCVFSGNLFFKHLEYIWNSEEERIWWNLPGGKGQKELGVAQ